MTSLLRLTIVALSSALCVSASAKSKPLTLSDFAGNYKGIGIAVIGGVITASATEAISVKVPKSGRSAVFSIAGILSAGGSSASFSNVIHLFASKTLTIQDLVFHVGGGNSLEARGNYRLSKGGVSFNCPFNVSGTTGFALGTIKTRMKGKSQRVMVLTYNLTAEGETVYSFRLEVSKRVKPPRK